MLSVAVPVVASDVGRVLVIDDEPTLRASLRRVLSTAGHTVLDADSRAGALDVLARSSVDVVVLDLRLSDGSGLEVLKTVQASTPGTAVVVYTASDAVEDMREAVRLGATAYLHKPTDSLTLVAQVSLALNRGRAATPVLKLSPRHVGGPGSELTSPLEALPQHLATQLSHAWDLRHIETGAHVRRMAESTRRLALALGTSETIAERLGRVAMLHDIGKIAIPDAILTKPGKLTDEEFAIMKRHTDIGGKMLSGFQHSFLDLAAVVARSHHERWDGSGYPDGLVGRACPWEARVVGVVDVFDALGHARCYKDAWSTAKLVDFFRVAGGKAFDPEIAAVLVGIIGELEAIKSEYPELLPCDQASGTHLKSAEVVGAPRGFGGV